MRFIAVRTQIIQPPVDTRVLLGHTATLQCKISSDPAVKFDLHWYKNKQYVVIFQALTAYRKSIVRNLFSPNFCLSRLMNPKSSQRISILKDGTLEIQAVRAADVGFYTCSIKSPGGNETRSAKLSVIELPYAPTNVKAERLDIASQRAVNVSWIPGFDGNSPIKQFIIQKREVPELGM